LHFCLKQNKRRKENLTFFVSNSGFRSFVCVTLIRYAVFTLPAHAAQLAFAPIGVQHAILPLLAAPKGHKLKAASVKASR
jgi:hypothetical protein